MRIFSEFEDRADGSGPAQTARELQQVARNLSSVKSTLVLSSVKGGSGKSTLAVNLAAALALSGRKAGIVDADLNAPNVLQMLGARPRPNFRASEGIEPVSALLGIRVVSSESISDGQTAPITFLGEQQPQAAPGPIAPAELSYAGALRSLLGLSHFGQLDLLIIDLAPGLEHLYRLLGTIKPTGVILVTNPSANAARAAASAFEMNSKTDAALLGTVENMVGFTCDNCRSVRPLFPDGEISRAAREAEVQILARLPFDPRLAESCDRGKVFVSENPETPIAKQLIEMAKKIDALLAARVRESEPLVEAAPAIRQA